MTGVTFGIAPTGKGRKRRRDIHLGGARQTVSTNSESDIGIKVAASETKFEDDGHNSGSDDNQPKTTKIDIITAGTQIPSFDKKNVCRTVDIVADCAGRPSNNSGVSATVKSGNNCAGKSQIARLIARRRAERASGQDEDAAFKYDMRLCVDMAKEEEYTRLPVEDFGKALLRSMGWDGNQDGKVVVPNRIKPRPRLQGLGAHWPLAEERESTSNDAQPSEVIATSPESDSGEAERSYWLPDDGSGSGSLRTRKRVHCEKHVARDDHQALRYQIGGESQSTLRSVEILDDENDVEAIQNSKPPIDKRKGEESNEHVRRDEQTHRDFRGGGLRYWHGSSSQTDHRFDSEREYRQIDHGRRDIHRSRRLR